MLDIGAGSGVNRPDWMHALIAGVAAAATGIELDDQLASRARAKGFNVVTGDAQQIDVGRDFEVIFAGEVIEHLSCPGAFLDGARRHLAPNGMLAAVTYLVEELHANVNARDHEGNTALHHAAARGDVEMIQYLVSKGADVMAVNREGKTTADMANGPVQRIQPWPDALALLEKLGAKNNHKCVSC